MEQVRTALTWIVRYHFWLLSILVPVVALGCWYVGASALKEKAEANIKTVSTAFTTQQSKLNREFHPSEKVNTGQRQQTELLKTDVTTTWEERYDRQRKDALQWPPQLRQQFRDVMRGLRFGDPIAKNHRAHYGDYIEGRFDDLPKIIDANELDDSNTGGNFGGRNSFGRGDFEGEGGGGGFGPRGGEGEGDVNYTVRWSSEDQQRIKYDLTWQETASHWRIWVTQEDLWVYENLLQAIANTNKTKRADRRSNAAITDVFALQVGKLAAEHSRTRDRIKRFELASASGDDLGGAGMDDRTEATTDDDYDDESRGGYGAEGREGGDSEFEKGLLLSSRYINSEGRPIIVPGDNEPLADDQFGSEIKQLPVHLVVRMDIRWLSALVAELANADLQIKVTEIRVGVDPSATGGGGLGGRGRGSFEGEAGGGGFGGRGGFGGGGNEEIFAFDRRPYMKTIVIQGVVLIFNPPNLDLLNAGGSSETEDNDFGNEEDFNTASI